MATTADPVAEGTDGVYVDADEADGADEAISRLYRAHVVELTGMIWAFLGDRAAAEDVVHESFMRMHQHWHRLRDPARAPAYLRSIAFNLSRSRLRHGAVVSRHKPEALAAISSAEEGTMLRADQQEVADALHSLPGRQRACLVLRYYADMTDVQIAADLGLSPSSVKTHIARGLAALETRLAGRI